MTVEAVRPSSPPVGAWMEGFGSELRAHVRRMLGSADDAEDVLQRVWITAHRSPPEASEPGRVRSWLYRVATNAALDRLAADRRRSRVGPARPTRTVPHRPTGSWTGWGPRAGGASGSTWPASRPSSDRPCG